MHHLELELKVVQEKGDFPIHPLLIWPVLTVLFFVFGVVSSSDNAAEWHTLGTDLAGRQEGSWMIHVGGPAQIQLSSQGAMFITRDNSQNGHHADYASSWSELGQATDILAYEAGTWRVSSYADVQWKVSANEAVEVILTNVAPSTFESLERTTLYGLSLICLCLTIVVAFITWLSRTNPDP